MSEREIILQALREYDENNYANNDQQWQQKVNDLISKYSKSDSEIKYLFTARGYNEPDNNTPSDEIWCKLVECEPSEVERYAKVFEDDMAGDYANGVEIEYRPLEMFKDEWVKVSEIW